MAQELRLGQVRLASSQGLLRLLPVLDVGAGSEPACDLSRAVAQRHPPAQEPTVSSIGAAQPGLDFGRLAVGERSLDLGLQPVAIMGMNRLHPSPAKVAFPGDAAAGVDSAARV